jgi:WD repeat-containing protein 24
VNRIAWNPYDPYSLLSGSQDGTMKMWDFREAEGKQPINFNAKCEVRDVQFSPFQSFLFAAGLENGAVQLWDARKNATPVNQINLHQGLVLTLMWHPSDRNLIASGGRDRVIQVWDTRHKAPSFNVQTISIVGKVTWRPTHHGTRALSRTASRYNFDKPHLKLTRFNRFLLADFVSSASLVDNSVHLWDYKDPYIPLASLSGAKDVITGHSWSPVGNVLLTCSKDGYLRSHDFDKHAYEPRKHITTTAISWNVRNQLVLLHERINRQENLIAVDTPIVQQESSSLMKYVGLGTSTSSASQSTSGDRRIPSLRSATLFSPHPITEDTPNVAPVLRKAAEHIHARFGATAVSAFDPGFDPAILQYFAEYYRYQGASIGELCEYNSNVARAIGKLDIAQSWVMLRTAFSSPKELMKLDDESYMNASAANPLEYRSHEGDYIDFDGDDGDVASEIYPGYISDFYRYFDYLEGGHQNDFMDDENGLLAELRQNGTTDPDDPASFDEQYHRDLEDAKWHIMNDVLPNALKLRGMQGMPSGAVNGFYGPGGALDSPTSMSMLGTSAELMSSPRGGDTMDLDDLSASSSLSISSLVFPC